MAIRNIASLGDLSGKRVLMREDFNVPVSGTEITDDGRIRAALPTINNLVAGGAALVILAHRGRPDGAPDDKYTLRSVAERLSELLGKEVIFFAEGLDEEAVAATKALEPGQVMLMENIRFYSGETSKDDAEREEFAAKLAKLGDVFVSDGFGVVHRKQASVYDIAKQLPSAAGLLVEKEVGILEALLESPEQPYTVVLGGSKVSDKLAVIDSLLPRVDALAIGGGMAFTFLAALGNNVAKSLLEADQIPTVLGYIEKAEKLGVKLILPTDVIVASTFSETAEHRTVTAEGIANSDLGADVLGLDIGPETATVIAEQVLSSKTVFWNGPMGVFELSPFASGTKTVAAALTKVNGLSVVGGGDSAAAVREFGYKDSDFGHISTGGGASLEFLEGKTLPGLEVLGW
ncbi:MAG: phosphoglycerate kinase [Microbacteriaceae bacterium]|nr:phosphoglycerate kinase [Microbacteriaceae bacterium]